MLKFIILTYYINCSFTPPTLIHWIENGHSLIGLHIVTFRGRRIERDWKIFQRYINVI